MESGYRLEVAVEALTHAAEDNGWTVLATTVAAEVCPVWIDEYEAVQLAGVQPHHLLGCDALGLDSS